MISYIGRERFHMKPCDRALVRRGRPGRAPAGRPADPFPAPGRRRAAANPPLAAALAPTTTGRRRRRRPGRPRGQARQELAAPRPDIASKGWQIRVERDAAEVGEDSSHGAGWRGSEPRARYRLERRGERWLFTAGSEGRGRARTARWPRTSDRRDGRLPADGGPPGDGEDMDETLKQALALGRLLPEAGVRARRAVPHRGRRAEPVVRRRLQHARRHLPRPGAVPESPARLRGGAAHQPRLHRRRPQPGGHLQRHRPLQGRPGDLPARALPLRRHRRASSTASCRASSPTCTPTSATSTSPPGSTRRPSPSTGGRSRSARPSSTSGPGWPGALRDAGERDAAMTEYEEVVKQSPTYVPARLNLGSAPAGGRAQGRGGRAVEGGAGHQPRQPERRAVPGGWPRAQPPAAP